MAKKRRKEVDILIGKVDFPDRAQGVILNDREQDDVDRLLEINSDYRTREKGEAVKLKGGIEGQVIRGAKNGRRVKLLEILEKSPLERESLCPHYAICGGCNYQTLPYPTELMVKQDQMRRLYPKQMQKNSIGLKQSPVIQGYRNKMEYTFGDKHRGGALTLGLHRPGHFYEIVPTPFCNIVPEDFNILRDFVETYFRERNVDYYHKRTKTGYLRHCVLRCSHSTKEIMLNLVTTSEEGMSDLGWTDFLEKLLSLNLSYTLVSVFHTINDSTADAVIPEELHHRYGSEYLTEEMAGLTFRVGPFSFFQPNTFTAEKLYEKALEFAGDLTGKTVYDLYSGTGTISQIAATKAQRVIGVEIVEEAVQKAKDSAEMNHLPNVKFLCNDVLEELDMLKEKKDEADVIILDPPRSGIHPKAIQKICDTHVPKIVYISCNPRTQKEDLILFEEQGYVVEKMMAFDQFPRTKHVECISQLVLKM